MGGGYPPSHTLAEDLRQNVPPSRFCPSKTQCSGAPAQYYEALDIVINDIKRRFQQDNFTLVSKIEKLFLDAANGNNVTIPDELREVYAGDIDFVALTRQLTSLQDVCDDERKPIKYIKTICEIFNNSPIYKRSFSEVHILLLIYLTIPVTMAGA